MRLNLLNGLFSSLYRGAYCKIYCIAQIRSGNGNYDIKNAGAPC